MPWIFTLLNSVSLEQLTGQSAGVFLIEDDRAEVIEIKIDQYSILTGQMTRCPVQNLPDGIVVSAIAPAVRLPSSVEETVIEIRGNVVFVLAAERVATIGLSVGYLSHRPDTKQPQQLREWRRVSARAAA